MEEKNQQDRLLGVNRELGDHPEGRVKSECASRGYEFRELPLWSLKPPYFPEMTLVSPLSETPTLSTPS
jgi:hypothetical protein